ncbi:hypothetical protein [Actinophytocola sp.]|uniref:hypothetical protein n=1 Tax=Actinophytocola sp. TaxID=1872138 RepID=UPI002ED28FBD
MALDSSVDAARERLRTTVERWYGAPFEVVSSLQAMFAGTPAGLRDWLDSYVDAGDKNPRRGLDALAGVIR